MLSVAIILFVALSGIAYIWIFRAEGIMAVYILGMPLLYVVIDRLGIPWSTALTGAVYPVIFFPCVIWWWLEHRDPQEQFYPRQWGATVIVILCMSAFWQVKHLFESQYIAWETIAEYYKWMYMIARWAAPFLLGILMPLSVKRLRRFLGALALLGVALGSMTILSWLTGTGSMERWGMRFSPAERLGALGMGVNCGAGAAAVLGYYLMSSEFRKSLGRSILVGLGLAVILLGILFSGSRGPLVSSVIAIIAALFLSGGRNAIRFGIGLTVLAVLLYSTYLIVPGTILHRVIGEGAFFSDTSTGGVEQRISVIRSAINMLSVAPIFGRTIGLPSILEGLGHAHNLTAEVMVELGLVGLIIYLTVFVPTLVRWVAAAFRKGSVERLVAAPIVACFVFQLMQNHINGELDALPWWLFLGIMAGHRLQPDVYETELQPELWAEQSAAGGCATPPG